MLDKYCGPFKWTHTQPLTPEQSQLVQKTKRRYRNKAIIGGLLIIFSFPVSCVIAYFINRWQYEAIALTFMFLGFFVGIPAGILILKDNLSAFRKIKRHSGNLEIYKGVVSENVTITMPTIGQYIPTSEAPVEMVLLEETPVVFSINGTQVLGESIFIEPSVIARADIEYLVDVPSSEFAGVPDDVTIQKRHMSEDEKKELAAFMKKNGKYFTLGGMFVTFISGLFIFSLYDRGLSGTYDKNGIFPMIMAGVCLLSTIVHHVTYIMDRKLNAQLKKDIEIKDVLVVTDKEKLQEVLPISGLVWTIDNLPAEWRVIHNSQY